MNEQKCNEIISRWRAGTSIRRIARDLGLARNTVSKVLVQIQARRESVGDTAPSRRRPRLLDPYEPVVQELLARYPELTAVRLWEELRQRGFAGGYTLVRQLLRELRPRSAPAPVTRFETAPGAQAQMDYAVYDIDFTAEGRRRVWLFSYILGHSRRQYLRFVESQDLATTVREHVRAFAHLGGVAATCLYDNMKVVVTGYENDVPIYNPRFLAFATHYGFRPIACRPRRPQTKGKVERPFGYVESSLLNGRSFETLNQLNQTTAWWLAKIADVRQLRHAGKTPLQLHQEELAHLIPLPAQPYDVWSVIYRAVNVEGFITYRQNGYSVPWRYIGSVLPVRVNEAEVIIYSPQIEEIARHPLLPCTMTGERSVQQEHRPSKDARLRQAHLEERFAQLGETGRRFLEGLLRTQRYGKDQAQRVLALLGTYSQGDLIAALERATRYGAYSHAAVDRILSVQAQPKSVLEALAEEERRHLPPWLDEEPVAPRPTSDYQLLCDQEPTEHAESTDHTEPTEQVQPAAPSDDSPERGSAPEDP
jgi:transposase